MTPERYLAKYKPGTDPTHLVESLADFLEAIAQGADLWYGGQKSYVTWNTPNSANDYAALKALGWDSGSDYGSHGWDVMFVYSPHPKG